MTLFHGFHTGSNYLGKILVVIYTNLPDTRNDTDVGSTYAIVAHKILDFALNSRDLSRKYIEFVFDTQQNYKLILNIGLDFLNMVVLTFIYLFIVIIVIKID